MAAMIPWNVAMTKAITIALFTTIEWDKNRIFSLQFSHKPNSEISILCVQGIIYFSKID